MPPGQRRLSITAAALLYLKQRQPEAAPPWTAVTWRLPMAYPMGMAGSLHSTTQEPASPLFPPDVCYSNQEVLAHFRDAGKRLLTCKEW